MARRVSVAGAAVRSLASLTGARIVSVVLQFIAFAMLARGLSPAGFGIFTFGLAFGRLFSVITNFGFKQVVTRDAAQRPEDEPWLLSNFFYLRIVLGVGAFAMLAGALAVTGYDPEQRTAALVAGTLLLLSSLESFTAALEIRLRMTWVAIADVVEAVALFGAVVVLLGAGAGVIAFLWAYVASNVLHGAIVTVAALRTAPLAWRPRFDRWIPLARAAAPLGLAAVLGIIYYQVDVAILARLKPAADVGEYGAAYRFLDAANLLPILMMTVLAPILARSFVEGREVLQRRFDAVVHLILLVAVPVSLVGLLTAWRVVPVIPGFSEYSRGGIALSILAPAAGFIFLAMIVQGTLVSAHLQVHLLRIAFLGAFLNALLNLALIPLFSLYAAGATTSLTEGLVVVLSVIALRRHVGVRFPHRSLVRIGRATVVMLVVVALGFAVHPFLQVVLAGLAYLAVILPTGAFRWSDLGGLLSSGTGRVIVVGSDVAATALGGDDVVAPVVATRPMGLWRACRGRLACEFRVPPRFGLLLAARLAGCAEVSLGPGVSRPGRFARQLLGGAEELVPDPAAGSRNSSTSADQDGLADPSGRRNP